MRRTTSCLRALAALAAGAVLFPLIAGAGEAKQEEKQRKRKTPEAKQTLNKDDGEAYPPDEYEAFKPAVLSTMQLGKLKLDIPGFSNVDKWSCIRKDTSEENPKTYIALPLKWPIDIKNWTPEPNGLRYLVSTDTQLVFGVDLNGDGRFVGKPENYNKLRDGTYGPIGLRLKYSDATLAPYSLVCTEDPKDSNRYFRFRSNIVWTGQLPSKRKRRLSEEIVLVDANNNALFNDYGQDLIKIGEKPLAPLSQVMIIKGKLYHVRVHESGGRVWSKPYAKPTGRLDILSNFKSPRRADLLMALVRNQTGTITLDVTPSGTKKRLKSYACEVPVGKWYIVDGVLHHKKEGDARLYHGNMDPIEVKQGDTASPEWGEPFELKGNITLNVTGINIDEVRIVGRSKEEYILSGKAAPIVEVGFHRRVVARGLIPIGPEGLYEAFFHEPRLKGIYKVKILLDSDTFGELEVGPKEVAFRPFGE